MKIEEDMSITGAYIWKSRILQGAPSEKSEKYRSKILFVDFNANLRGMDTRNS